MSFQPALGMKLKEFINWIIANHKILRGLLATHTRGITEDEAKEVRHGLKPPVYHIAHLAVCNDLLVEHFPGLSRQFSDRWFAGLGPFTPYPIRSFVYPRINDCHDLLKRSSRAIYRYLDSLSEEKVTTLMACPCRYSGFKDTAIRNVGEFLEYMMLSHGYWHLGMIESWKLVKSDF